jgi:hypothetical protein
MEYKISMYLTTIYNNIIMEFGRNRESTDNNYNYSLNASH